ncbi:MAG: pyruvate kinase [Defluviitaleaceae bacterium]|nr:pyruvate kinase [Defluviitaleaceae bacterium]
MRKTKIVATLGPASNNIEIMKNLINSGLNVARFNFSHGTHESHREMANTMKKASKELGVSVALMLDTKGPEIRTKALKADTIELKEGNKFILTSEDIIGDENRVSITHNGLSEDVKIGGKILLDDGLIELLIDNITDTNVECTILNGGILKANKGVNLPNVEVSLPSLTEKDIEDIKFAIAEDFDFIAASFVRTANDLKEIKRILKENNGSHIKIISKIENRQGVDNIDEILELTDSIMVARGDLGVEIDPEEVPIIQKSLIKKANKLGKPVITATQMLESMINNPRPTRAETSDVANAIIDGTDAIMLSGETAGGKYPEEAVKMMARIATKTEESLKYNINNPYQNADIKTTPTDAVGYAATSIAKSIEASAIITLTTSGFTANMISKFRPITKTISITPDKTVFKQLNLTWGSIPILADCAAEPKELLAIAVKTMSETNYLKKGDSVVIVSGMPLGIAGTTNNIRIYIIGDEI